MWAKFSINRRLSASLFKIMQIEGAIALVWNDTNAPKALLDFKMREEEEEWSEKQALNLSREMYRTIRERF